MFKLVPSESAPKKRRRLCDHRFELAPAEPTPQKYTIKTPTQILKILSRQFALLPRPLTQRRSTLTFNDLLCRLLNDDPRSQESLVEQIILVHSIALTDEVKQTQIQMLNDDDYQGIAENDTWSWINNYHIQQRAKAGESLSIDEANNTVRNLVFNQLVAGPDNDSFEDVEGDFRNAYKDYDEVYASTLLVYGQIPLSVTTPVSYGHPDGVH